MNDEKAIEQLEEFLVIDDWSAVYMPYLQDAIEYVINRIKALEERQTGEWVDYSNEGYVECPFCGSATNCDDNKDELHYCWNCGAKMQKGDVE